MFFLMLFYVLVIAFLGIVVACWDDDQNVQRYLIYCTVYKTIQNYI